MHAETVSISKDGTLYLPDKHGRIWTSAEGGKGEPKELGYAGGRPLGGHVYPNGDAIFCDMVQVCKSMTDLYCPTVITDMHAMACCMPHLHADKCIFQAGCLCPSSWRKKCTQCLLAQLRLFHNVIFCI